MSLVDQTLILRLWFLYHQSTPCMGKGACVVKRCKIAELVYVIADWLWKAFKKNHFLSTEPPFSHIQHVICFQSAPFSALYRVRSLCDHMWRQIFLQAIKLQSTTVSNLWRTLLKWWYLSFLESWRHRFLIPKDHSNGDSIFGTFYLWQ